MKPVVFAKTHPTVHRSTEFTNGCNLYEEITHELAVVCAQVIAADGHAQAPDAEAQLILDTTTVPVGMGALFVPSITSQEASFTVALDGGRVSLGKSGTRVVLPPGRYDIALNIGKSAAAPRATVDVKAAPGEVVEYRVTLSDGRIRRGGFANEPVAIQDVRPA